MTFDEFVRANTRGLIGLAIAMSGDPHLAEDVVQDVLIKAHRRWAHISTLADPPSYVRRMVTNEYLSWRRKWARVIPIGGPETFEHVPGAPDPAAQHADHAALAQQLRRLTRQQRAVLALRFYVGLPDPEIAQTLGCSESSVRSHASRALATLRVNSGDLLTSTEESR